MTSTIVVRATAASSAAPARARRPVTPGSVVRVVVLSIIALYFVLPIIWLVLAPSKDRHQFVDMPAYSFGSFENYGKAFENLLSFNDGELLRWLGNSVFYTVAATVVTLVTVIPAGYALARTTMPLRRAILLITMVAMVTPGAARTIPIYLTMNTLGLLNTPAAVIVPAMFYPAGVYLSYIYFSTSLSPSLIEAARLDGVREFGIFTRIALPLASPIIGLITFFSFVSHWTEFFGPYILLSDDKLFPVSVGLASLMASSPGINPSGVPSDLPIYQPEAALAGLIVVVPVLIVFLISQRYLARGIFDGAVKD